MSDDEEPPALEPVDQDVGEAAAGAGLKKKKKKKRGGGEEGEDSGMSGDSPSTSTAELAQQIASLSMDAQSQALARSQPATAMPGTDQRAHAFWSTQPMRRPEEQPSTGGPIEPVDKEIRQEPYKLPGGFVWCTCDITKDEEMADIYKLLNENYVEDDDNMFRFDYSIPFLRWALQPPEYKAEWHVGVRAEKSGKLVGFITAIPAGMRAWDEKFSAVEINFLCVHKKLRSKRLAPVLIKEVTRRVNVNGIFQAVYTAGAVLPTPVASCRYYHRSLNPKKLIDVGFSRLAPRMTMARTLKLYKLPEEPLLRASGLRKMEPADVPQACALLRAHLSKFALAASFSEAEMSHWFLERPGVVYCYVIQDPLTHNITDMLSFYALPSTIIGNKQYPTLNAAYSFYNVANTVSLTALVNDALILAKSLDFDVFNALNILGNDECLNELKFGIGDGQLQYYLYNWSCRDMRPHQVGLVLL